MSSLDPKLPLELEKEIFEIAAHRLPATIPAMLLTARRVKIWVEPIFFRVVLLAGLRGRFGLGRRKTYPLTDNSNFSRIVSTPPAVLRDSVHHLHLDQVPKRVAELLLSSCQNVHDLWLLLEDYTCVLELVSSLTLPRTCSGPTDYISLLLFSASMSSSASTSSAHVLRSRLAEIDAEAAALHARLSVLAAERKTIAETLGSVIYSGVLELPPEITAEIFLQYVTRAEIGHSDPNAWGWTPSYGPLLLASVCRKWREIALGLQPIGSNFEILTSDTALESADTLLEYWLSRGGNHPLTISVCADPTSIFPSPLPAIHPLQSLECYVDSAPSFPNELFHRRLPSLQSLRLFFSMQEQGPLATSLTAFADCPRLCDALDTFYALREDDFLPELTSLSLDPYISAMEIPFAALAEVLDSRAKGKSGSFELVLRQGPTVHRPPTPTVVDLSNSFEALRAVEAGGPKLKIRCLQNLTEKVDAMALYAVQD
ncbi:hypothetical protein FB45DRAFT_1055682 [Roridomyces roridus]|uniref:F-box domain-containing protein n=1 Tax=Roridomyces roridus TaxID=1738132 RepID=A0AAD7C0Y0_9AGAR|nr:hypothetical protein FB45DRAFT_1055682 [Roridomyces roridus]